MNAYTLVASFSPDACTLEHSWYRTESAALSLSVFSVLEAFCLPQHFHNTPLKALEAHSLCKELTTPLGVSDNAIKQRNMSTARRKYRRKIKNEERLAAVRPPWHPSQ